MCSGEEILLGFQFLLYITLFFILTKFLEKVGLTFMRSVFQGMVILFFFLGVLQKIIP